MAEGSTKYMQRNRGESKNVLFCVCNMWMTPKMMTNNEVSAQDKAKDRKDLDTGGTQDGGRGVKPGPPMYDKFTGFINLYPSIGRPKQTNKKLLKLQCPV